MDSRFTLSAGRQPDWVKPSRLPAVWRQCKVIAHIALRTLQNRRQNLRRWQPNTQWQNANIVAEFQSPLWTDGRSEEHILVCGKIQNLRVAARAFNGIEVPAGEILSFWTQVGHPTARRGFSIGREVIAGCIVPTIGGGLCQLSNALASTAVAAGICLVERHRHSALIEGHQPTAPEDATVAWNYVDLRLQSEVDFRVEVELTTTELVVRIRTPKPSVKIPLSIQSDAVEERPVARGCLTCHETTCFRHIAKIPDSSPQTVFLLNETSPELNLWLRQHPNSTQWWHPWSSPRNRMSAWQPPTPSVSKVAYRAAIRRLWRRSQKIGELGAWQAERQRQATDLVDEYRRWLKPTHNSLVVTQSLLVPLWRSGELGGRYYSVYMTEMPVVELQRRLDGAADSVAHQQTSLRDFRVDRQWQLDELAALKNAKQALTAHTEIEQVLENLGVRVKRLPWQLPTLPVTRRQRDRGSRITLTLAASALPRKGAFEVAELARRLRARVLILGSAPTDIEHWNDVEWQTIGYHSDWLSHTDVALLPAVIEHRPRALLQALTAGLPVVATKVCGLPDQPGLHWVSYGDVDELEAVVRSVLIE